MDIEKLNMQMMMKDIFNSCQAGEVFEDRDELKEFRSDLEYEKMIARQARFEHGERG